MRLKLNRFLFLGVASASFLYSQNLNYASHDNHTLTVPKENLDVSLEYQLMNNTVDILNIKDKEFGNSSKYDAIGDLDGYSLKLRYGISDDLMISAKYNTQNVSYGSNELENTNIDMFVRYNLFNHKNALFNSGISLDIGYVENKLNDFFVDSLDQINDLSNRYFSSSDVEIKQIKDNNDPILNLGDYYIPNNTTPDPNDKVKLDEKPWIGLKNTYDESFYLKLLTGIHTKNTLYDFYIGIKNTKISNDVTSNNDLLTKASSQGYNIQRDLSRDENMYFIGFNITHETKELIYEFGYEYERFDRDEGLDYIDFNHVFDLTLNYKINKNILFYVGGKIMYRQFNGQIPYLYNEYSQTTYDHKYGYSKFGIQYTF